MNFYQAAQFTPPMVMGMEEIHDIAKRLVGCGVAEPDVMTMFATYIAIAASEGGPDNIRACANAVGLCMEGVAQWTEAVNAQK